MINSNIHSLKSLFVVADDVSNKLSKLNIEHKKMCWIKSWSETFIDAIIIEIDLIVDLLPKIIGDAIFTSYSNDFTLWTLENLNDQQIIINTQVHSQSKFEIIFNEFLVFLLLQEITKLWVFLFYVFE